MLSITLSNERVDTMVKVNGQRVKFKKIIINKKAYRRGSIQANGEVTLSVFNYYDLQRHSFFYVFFLWFLGAFGIFFKKFEYTFNLDAEATFVVNGDLAIDIEFNRYIRGEEQPAIQIMGATGVRMIRNRYFTDSILEKRTKRYNRLFGFFTFLSFIGLAVFLISLI